MTNAPQYRSNPEKPSRAGFIKAHPKASPEELIELGKKAGHELDRGMISRVRWVVRTNEALAGAPTKKTAKKKPKKAKKKAASAKRTVRFPMGSKKAVIGDTVVTYNPAAIADKYKNLRKDKRAAHALATGIDLNDTPERIAARVVGDAINTLVLTMVKKEFRRILAESAG